MRLKKKNYIVIVGCSQFGATIASTFSQQGCDVVVIDQNDMAFRKLEYGFSGYKVIKDGTDVEVLIQAGIEQASLVVAATDDDNANLMISQMAKEIFNVEEVVSRLYDVDKQILYRDLNITMIRPTRLTMDEFDKLVMKREGGNSNEGFNCWRTRESRFLNEFIT